MATCLSGIFLLKFTDCHLEITSAISSDVTRAIIDAMEVTKTFVAIERELLLHFRGDRICGDIYYSELPRDHRR